jgi:hypothetical protein
MSMRRRGFADNLFVCLRFRSNTNCFDDCRPVVVQQSDHIQKVRTHKVTPVEAAPTAGCAAAHSQLTLKNRYETALPDQVA